MVPINEIELPWITMVKQNMGHYIGVPIHHIQMPRAAALTSYTRLELYTVQTLQRVLYTEHRLQAVNE